MGSLTMQRITNARSAADFFRKRMSLDVEEVWVAGLNADKRILAAQCLFRGTADQCLVHPRDIFRFACLHNVTGLLVAHNHPSGVARPSKEDDIWTEQLRTAAEILMIPLLDHLVVTRSGYYSYLERGRLFTEDDRSAGGDLHKVFQECDQE